MVHTAVSFLDEATIKIASFHTHVIHVGYDFFGSIKVTVCNSARCAYGGSTTIAALQCT